MIDHPGHWEHAVRVTEPDGDVMIWDSASSTRHEPFLSEDEALIGMPTLVEGEYDLVRRWVKDPDPWQTIRKLVTVV